VSSNLGADGNGNSDGAVNGNSDADIDGNSDGAVNGNSDADINGNSDAAVNGDGVSTVDSNGTNGDSRADRPRPPVAPPTFGSRIGSMGVPGETSEDFRGSTARLLRTMGPERKWAAFVLLCAFVSVALAVTGPRLLGHATNIIVAGVQSGNGVNFTKLRNVLLLTAALYITSAALQWLQSFTLAGVVQRTMFRLRRDVEEKIHRLSLRYVDSQPRGDLLSTVTNDIDNVAQSLQQTLSQLLTATLTIIGVVIMMFLISPLLASVAFLTIPISLLIVKLVTKRSKKYFIQQWRHTGTLNAQIEEAFTGHSLVRVFGRQGAVEADFRDKNEELYEASFHAQFIAGTIQPAMMFLGNLNYVAIAVIGGLQVSSGRITIGDIQAFIQYTRQFTQPLTQMASMANVLQSGIASVERVFALLDVDEQSPDEVLPLLEMTPRGRIEFDNVSFSYDPKNPLIKDLSLVAEPGHTIAIVGPTGAGKTTLVNLIMRFYDIDRGTIRLDGVDISTMRRSELRSNIGMVLQDTWLFSGTIRENIRYGNLDATDEQVLTAAKATYVDRFVHSLPEGYDTRIDDEGGTVSAGEKQLLTIARAFLADPAILILDEATSSVDTRTEVLIQHAMAALRSQRTSFVIAHRLSTIRDADLILVMEEGRIVETGNHLELLEKRGAYYNLYNAQFAGPVSETV
jgi:ATP-binding cassette subfamily B protein